MLHRVKYIVSVLGLLFVLVSCDKTIHEYPTDPTITLNLTCEIDNAAPEYFTNVENEGKGTSYIVRTQSTAPRSTRFEEPVVLRYVFDLYRVVASHSEFVERKVVYTPVNNPVPEAIQFELEAAEYKVLVWCDYVKESAKEEDWYYKTGDLRNIRYTDIEVKDNNDKDVFTDMLHLNLREYSYSVTDHELSEHLILERPNGRYKCITTDVGSYIGKDKMVKEITTVVTYVLYVADGYNVEEQKPNHFEVTRSFLSTVNIDDAVSGQLEMCYDYVLVNGKQSNVKINFEFYKGILTMGNNGLLYRADGTPASEDDRISNWSGIVVPLKRNHETVVIGDFLTQSFGSGGIGIEPGFEGEIVIPWE